MMAKARIIVVVSHDLDSLSQLYRQAIWLDHGRLCMSGATSDVVAAYRQTMQEKLLPSAGSSPLSPTA